MIYARILNLSRIMCHTIALIVHIIGRTSTISLRMTATSSPVSINLDLPPNWTPDNTLRDELQAAGLDHRHFQRLPEAPTRYAVNILGTAPHVWDLRLKQAVPPMQAGSNGKQKLRKSKARYPRHRRPKATQTSSRKRQPRLRFRLNLGKTAGLKWSLLSRLICQAVHGAPPRSNSHAHHDDGDTLNNHWRNLHWRSPAANQAIERIRPERMRTQRTGAANSNGKLTFGQLFHLIREYDDQQISERDLAFHYDLSPAQVHRLVTAQSRTAEVNDIRWRLSAGAAHRDPAS